MNKVTPFLWFDHQAEEAMNFYVSVFKNSKITSVNRVDGRVMTVNFELDGQPFIALNAGPHFKFNEAVSFFINCDTQEEVDLFWDRLSEGGREIAVRLVERPMGLVVAGRAEGPDTPDGRSGFRQIESRARCDAQDEEDCHRRPAAGVRPRSIRTRFEPVTGLDSPSIKPTRGPDGLNK
jgi:uncharacterized glyoxalase superfamily protein PhnB